MMKKHFSAEDVYMKKDLYPTDNILDFSALEESQPTI